MKRQFVWMFVLGAGLAGAQTPEPNVVFRREIKGTAGVPGPDVMMYRQEAGPGPFTVDFIGAEMSFADRPVKGAPYAADAVTETTQTLSDGNRITRKSTATIYRDSQGRTRREETLGAIGPWASAGSPLQHVFINDPAAGTSYVLNPQNRTAHKLMMRVGEFHAAAPAGVAAAGAASNIAFGAVAAAAPAEMVEPSVGVAVTESTFDTPIDTVKRRMVSGGMTKLAVPDVKKETLGKQTFEGVEADGTRSTITIPAGAIGNDRPIESASEQWSSRELQTVVMSKRSDPRFGETTYRLTNIRRGEQPASLFEVPSDYTATDEMPMEKMMDFRKKAAEAK